MVTDSEKRSVNYDKKKVTWFEKIIIIIIIIIK